MKPRGILALAVVAMPAAAQVTVTGAIRQLTTNPAAQLDPAISSDIVVYTDFRNGNADVYYYDLARRVEVPVATGPQDEQLTDVSGNTIVFTDYASTTGGGDVGSFVIGSGQGVVAGLSTSAQRNPGVGGAIVAWEDNRDGNFDIYGKDLSSGIEKRITATSSDVERDPKVSNGLIAYSSLMSTVCQIFVADFATGATRQLTNQAACHAHPDISGNIVVYEGTRDGDQDIYVYDLAANRETRMLLPGVQRNARVSGDWVAFEDIDSGTSDIRLYHVPTGALFTVSGTPSNEWLNDIDGTRVAFTSDAAGNFDIYLYEFTAAIPSSGKADNCTHLNGAQPLFDKTYTRAGGSPHGHSRCLGHRFSDFFAAAPGPGLVCVDNVRTSSAKVEVNGRKVVREHQLNANVALVQGRVELKAMNHVEVEMRSRPGASLRVRIYPAAPHDPDDHDVDDDEGRHHHAGQEHYTLIAWPSRTGNDGAGGLSWTLDSVPYEVPSTLPTSVGGADPSAASREEPIDVGSVDQNVPSVGCSSAGDGPSVPLALLLLVLAAPALWPRRGAALARRRRR